VNRYTFFIGAALGTRGAVSKHFQALADELVKRGHQVVFLPWGKGSPKSPREGNPAVYPWPSPRPTRIQDALFLLRLVKQFRPHCLIGTFGSVNIMIVIGFITGVPCRIAWYQTLVSQNDIDWVGSKWRLIFLRWRKKWIYKMTTHIISNSIAGMEDVQKIFGVPTSKCSFAYFGLPDPLATTVGWNAFPHRVDNLIVCVGRFVPCKGQDVLLRAMTIVSRQIPDARVRFIGGGRTLAECKTMASHLGIEHMCEFIGSVPHDEVFDHMSSAAVVVIPSRSDALPWVAIEAIAVGTPVIATRVGGLPEVIRDGVEGFLVPPEDPNSLAESIVRVLKDRDLRERLGQNARARFLQTFEQGKVVKMQADWLEKIVAEALMDRK